MPFTGPARVNWVWAASASRVAGAAGGCSARLGQGGQEGRQMRSGAEGLDGVLLGLSELEAREFVQGQHGHCGGHGGRRRVVDQAGCATEQIGDGAGGAGQGG